MAFPGPISTSESGRAPKLYEYYQIKELIDSNPDQIIREPVSLVFINVSREVLEKAIFLPSEDNCRCVRCRRFENVQSLSFSNPGLSDTVKYFPEALAFNHRAYPSLEYTLENPLKWNLNDRQISQIVTDLPNLTSLNLSCNQGLEGSAFSSIASCTRLRKLNLSATEVKDQFLKTLSEGNTLPKTLEDLDLSSNSEITAEGLPYLSRFSALTHLKLPASLDFSQFPPMPQLLEFQLIFEGKALTELQSKSLLKIIPQMTALRRLNLSLVGSEGEFDEDEFNRMLSQLPELVELNIFSNKSVKHLNGVRGLKQLECLEIGHSSVSDFSFLESLPQLRRLNISGIEGAGKMIPLLAKHLPQLEELDISSCELHFEDCMALGPLKNLRRLKITQSPFGYRFDYPSKGEKKVEAPYLFLSDLPALEFLEVEGLRTLQEVKRIKSHCPNLRELRIFDGTVFFDENGEMINLSQRLMTRFYPDERAL